MCAGVRWQIQSDVHNLQISVTRVWQPHLHTTCIYMYLMYIGIFTPTINQVSLRLWIYFTLMNISQRQGLFPHISDLPDSHTRPQVTQIHNRILHRRSRELLEDRKLGNKLSFSSFFGLIKNADFVGENLSGLKCWELNGAIETWRAESLSSFYCLNSVSMDYSEDQVWVRRGFQELSGWIIILFPLKRAKEGPLLQLMYSLRTPTIYPTITHVRTIKQLLKHLKKSLWGPVTCLCPHPQVGNTVWAQICGAIWYNLTPQRALGLTWELAEDGYLKICLFSPRHLPVSPACTHTHTHTYTHTQSAVHVWPILRLLCTFDPTETPSGKKQSWPLTSAQWVSQLFCNNHTNTSNIWATGAIKEEYVGHLTVTPLQPWCALSSLYHLIWLY